MRSLVRKIKIRTWIILGVALVLMPIAVITLYNPSESKAEWFDDSWAYRQKIPVTTHTAAETNVYIGITVDTATLTTDKLQADCDDLRFTDSGGKPLPYQIVSGCDTATTSIRVGFETMAVAPFNFYMYYGNPNATIGSSTLSHSACGNGCAVGAFGSEEKGEGPIAYWKFDEGTDNTCANGTDDACDSTVNAKGGTRTGATWQSEDFCISGKCLLFDGTDDVVTVSGTVGGVQTVSFWVKVLSTSTTQEILDLNATDTFSSVSGVVTVAGFGTDTIYVDGVSGATTLTASRWHYVTVTTTTGFSASAIKMGQIGANFGNVFLDELKFYNYARTAAQVRADFIKVAGDHGSSAVFGAQSTSFLSSGLVGYWKMDETTTNTCPTAGDDSCDSSGNGNDGLFVNNSATSGRSKFGYAVFFDGVNDNTAFGDNDLYSINTTNQFTASIWTRLDSTSTSQHIVGKVNSPSNFEWKLGTNGSAAFLAEVYQSDGTILMQASTANSFYSASIWYHLVMTVDLSASVTRLFVDGVLVAEDTTAVGSYTNGTAEMRSGENDNSTGDTTGRVDDLRIYNKVLSSGEVRSLYSWAPGPKAHWKLDEGSWNNNCSTATVIDSSGNGLNGTSCPSTTGPTGGVSGVFGRAGAFDGSDDYVNVADNSILYPEQGSWSVGLWVKAADTDQTSPVITKRQNAGDFEQWGFQICGSIGCASNGQQLLFIFRTNVNNQRQSLTNADVADGRWHHFEAVADLATDVITIYLDGVKQAVSTQSNGSWPVVNNIDPVRFANNNSTTYGNISLDDIRIYNYGRTPAQVIEDMNAGHPAGGSPISSPTIHWGLDEQQGTVANNSNYAQSSLSGTLSGPDWKTNTSCKFNGCVDLNVSTDYITAGDTAFTDGLTAMSVSFWIDPNSQSTNKAIVSKSNFSSQNSFSVSTSSGAADAIRVYIASSLTDTTNYYGTDSILVGTAFQHIAVVYDGSAPAATRVKVYRNGRLAPDGVSSGTIPTSLTSGSTSNLKVGASDDTVTQVSLNTLIDEVKIYNFALTESQVGIDMNAGGAINFGSGVVEGTQDVSFPAPVGEWKLDAKTGTSAFDTSGNGRTGTLTSMEEEDWLSGGDCKYGSCLVFDGTGEFVDVGTGPSSVQAVTFWVRPASTTEYILDLNGTDYIWINSGTLTAQNFGTEIVYVNGFPTSSISAGVWSHVTVATTSGLNASDFDIGRVEGVGNMNGRIDNVKLFSSGLSTSQAAYDFSRGRPVGWWQFDECQGNTANDNTGNGNNGTISVFASGNTALGTCGSGVSTEIWDDGTNGKFNGSLGFDGTNDEVLILDSTLLNPEIISVSAWIKTSATGQTDQIFSKDNSSGAGPAGRVWQFRKDTSEKLRFLVFNASSSDEAIGATSISDGNWHHVVGTWDGGTIRVYVDGRLDGQQTFSGTLRTGQINNAYIGRGNNVDPGYFTGQIDDVRLYDFTLSQNIIRKIYNNDAGSRFGPDSGSP